MTLYQKRQHLRGLRSAYDKLAHHLIDLRSRVQTLTEDVRQEELELYIATVEGAVTYIPEGKSSKRPTKTPSPKVVNPSSKVTKKYVNYISKLSSEDRLEFLISLRDSTPTSSPKGGNSTLEKANPTLEKVN